MYYKTTICSMKCPVLRRKSQAAASAIHKVFLLYYYLIFRSMKIYLPLSSESIPQIATAPTSTRLSGVVPCTRRCPMPSPARARQELAFRAVLGKQSRNGCWRAAVAREVSDGPKRCKLAHAFMLMWQYSYKGLELAQILGQLSLASFLLVAPSAHG